MRAIGDRLAFVVDDFYESRKAAAQAMGVNPALLSRWITNPDRPPGEKTILDACELVGANPWWVRYGVGRPFAGRAIEGEDDLGEIRAIIEEHGDLRSLLRHFEVEEVVRAAYKAALSESWGLEAVQSLTRFARGLLAEGDVLEMLSGGA